MGSDEKWGVIIIAILVLIVIGLGGWGIHYAWIWRSDMGACLKSHQEPRHTNAWLEMRTIHCGKDCTTTTPIYHPAEDWIETVCDLYQYPDGNGPNCGSARKAANR